MHRMPTRGALKPFLQNKARRQADRLHFTPGDIACMEGSILATISATKLSSLAISDRDAKLHKQFLCRMSRQAMTMKRRPVIVQKVDDRGRPSNVWLMTSFGGKKIADLQGINPRDIAVVHPTEPYDQQMLTVITNPPWRKHPQYVHLIPVNVGVRRVTNWQVESGRRMRVTPQTFQSLSREAEARAKHWKMAPPEDVCQYNMQVDVPLPHNIKYDVDITAELFSVSHEPLGLHPR